MWRLSSTPGSAIVAGCGRRGALRAVPGGGVRWSRWAPRSGRIRTLTGWSRMGPRPTGVKFVPDSPGGGHVGVPFDPEDEGAAEVAVGDTEWSIV